MVKKPKSRPPRRYEHAGQPTKYKAEYCQAVIDLGKLGKSPEQIAATLNIDRPTLYAWSAAHPQFLTAFNQAKLFEQQWWEDIAQKALFADKFQAVVWHKSMAARFREKYTERQDVNVNLSHEDALKALK